MPFDFTQYVKSYLSNKPHLLQKYVNVGYYTAYHALAPVNALLKHLILVQGLDPNAVPGEKGRRELQQALHGLFTGFHDGSFDKDYDFSWINKKFEDTRKKLADLDLTPEKFRQYTNVGNLQATQALDVEQVKEPVVNLDTPEGRQNFRSLMAQDAIFATTDTQPSDPVGELADYFSTLDTETVRSSLEDDAKVSIDDKIKSAKDQYDNVSADTLKSAMKSVVDYATGLETTPRASWENEAVETVTDYRQRVADVRNLVRSFRDTGDQKHLKEAMFKGNSTAPALGELEQLKKEPITGFGPALSPEELFARTDYLRNIKETIEQQGVEVAKETEKLLPRRVLSVKKARKSGPANSGAKGEKNAPELSDAKQLVADMVLRGLCMPGVYAVEAQEQEVMKFDMLTFEAMKRIVAKQPLLADQEGKKSQFKGNFKRAPKPTGKNKRTTRKS